MQSVWGVCAPVREGEFPGPVALRKRLRRCGCGQMTFLSLPCRNCGARKSEPAFRWALRKAWARRIGRWILAVAYMLLAGCVAFQIWAPFAWLIAAGTITALVADLIRSTADGDICYWLFHDSGGGKKKLADAARIEALTDAYDGDLRRLERMLDEDPKSAQRVFCMAQELTEVFHNRRISALLANCLVSLPISEGICIDLDQICAWLKPFLRIPDSRIHERGRIGHSPSHTEGFWPESIWQPLFEKGGHVKARAGRVVSSLESRGGLFTGLH